MVDHKPYKSDPMFGCNISLEKESILERIRCSLIQPLQLAYSLKSVVNQLNDVIWFPIVWDELNIDRVISTFFSLV